MVEDMDDRPAGTNGTTNGMTNAHSHRSVTEGSVHADGWRRFA
jgi:hypothetical protein